jgi:membrane protein
MIRLERIIVESLPVRFISLKAKKINPPGFQGIALYDVLKFFLQNIRKTGFTERAAAISYNFIMSIPPICLFLFTLIPHLPFVPIKTIKMQLHSLITDVIPAKVHNKNLIAFVDSFLGNDPRIGLLSFGFILSLFFASNGMMGIMRSFNKGYVGFEKRRGLETRGVAIRLTMIIMGLLLACLLLLIAQGAIVSWFNITNVFVKYLITIIRWALIIGLIFSSISFIYIYAPALKKRWKWMSPGSILATFLSLLVTLGFSIFVNNFGKYNALYGSIGTVMVFMILIFINSLVLLIGYELNVSIHSLRFMAEERMLQEKNSLTKA